MLSQERTDLETGQAGQRTEVGEGEGEEDEAGEAWCRTQCQACSPSPSRECRAWRETSGRLHFQDWMASFPGVMYTFHRASLTEFFLAVFLLLS